MLPGVQNNLRWTYTLTGFDAPAGTKLHASNLCMTLAPRLPQTFAKNVLGILCSVALKALSPSAFLFPVFAGFGETMKPNPAPPIQSYQPLSAQCDSSCSGAQARWRRSDRIRYSWSLVRLFFKRRRSKVCFHVGVNPKASIRGFCGPYLGLQ